MDPPGDAFDIDRLASLLFRIETGIELGEVSHGKLTLSTGSQYVALNGEECELLEAWLASDPETDSDHWDPATKWIDGRRNERVRQRVKLLVAWNRRTSKPPAAVAIDRLRAAPQPPVVHEDRKSTVKRGRVPTKSDETKAFELRLYRIWMRWKKGNRGTMKELHKAGSQKHGSAWPTRFPDFQNAIKRGGEHFRDLAKASTSPLNPAD